MISPELYYKYNIPAPRYTSYPTVPYWDTALWNYNDYISALKIAFNQSNDNGISVYIHLPYCESLCTFCACNKRITKQHSVEIPYIEAVKKEWDLYVSILSKQPKLKELHIGGGTPTFFSVENLESLLNHILQSSVLSEIHEFSFEGHPNNTTKEHLEALYDLGFRRLSFGIQDYDEKVQQAIHRVQSFEQVKMVTNLARQIGYTSISHDLIFGLPFQQISSIEETIEKTNLLRPDRIAFYSYAHVPWIKGVGQRGFLDSDLPSGEEKRKLYESGKKLLSQNGYLEIALDHFALTHDNLYEAYKNKTIHRNFMGYTAQHTDVMLSLGVSSISDSWTAFAQNEKSIEPYIESVNAGKLPLTLGHLLTKNDKLIRKIILDIMCTMQCDFSVLEKEQKVEINQRLLELANDGLIKIAGEKLNVTDKGKIFLRNIALAFDIRYFEKTPDGKIFSMSI